MSTIVPARPGWWLVSKGPTGEILRAIEVVAFECTPKSSYGGVYVATENGAHFVHDVHAFCFELDRGESHHGRAVVFLGTDHPVATRKAYIPE